MLRHPPGIPPVLGDVAGGTMVAWPVPVLPRAGGWPVSLEMGGGGGHTQSATPRPRGAEPSGGGWCQARPAAVPGLCRACAGHRAGEAGSTRCPPAPGEGGPDLSGGGGGGLWSPARPGDSVPACPLVSWRGGDWGPPARQPTALGGCLGVVQPGELGWGCPRVGVSWGRGVPRWGDPQEGVSQEKGRPRVGVSLGNGCSMVGVSLRKGCPRKIGAPGEGGSWGRGVPWQGVSQDNGGPWGRDIPRWGHPWGRSSPGEGGPGERSSPGWGRPGKGVSQENGGPWGRGVPWWGCPGGGDVPLTWAAPWVPSRRGGGSMPRGPPPI